MPERSEGYDSTNVRHIRIAEKQAKAEEDARRVFVSTIMGMGGGRAYVHSLLVYCHVFAQPFSVSANETAFRCGQLDVGQVLLRDIMQYCPDRYVEMMREANARSSASDARRRRSDEDANRGNSEPGQYRHPSLDFPERSEGRADSQAATEPGAGAEAGEYDPFERDEAGDEE